MNFLSALVVLLAGLAVGATSIGGILVVPALTVLGDVPVRDGIAASNFSFLFTGAASIFLQRRAGRAIDSPPASATWTLYGAALVGAAAGALTLHWLPTTLVRLGVAGLAVLSGAMAIRGAVPATASGASRGPQGTFALVCIGCVVGCTSAWSGTGGPVLLLPILLLARAPTVGSIALAQGIQLPIAASATAANLATGQLDLRLGLILGVLLMLGWGVGSALSRRMPVALLRKILGFGLIAVGLWYCRQSL